MSIYYNIIICYISYGKITMRMRNRKQKEKIDIYLLEIVLNIDIMPM